jgi:hypothetical protein
MEVLSLSVAAGEPRWFHKQGGYFEIISAQAPLSVAFAGQGGAEANEAIGVEAGFYCVLPYTQFSITSAVAQDLRLMISDRDAGSKALPGMVGIINRIGAGVRQIEGSGAPLLSTVFYQSAIITPAQNQRGIRVRKAGVGATAGGGQADIALIAAPSAPATMVPSIAYNLARTAPTGAAVGNDTNSNQAYELPSGWGIYVATQHAVAPASAAYTFVYELL